VQKKETCVAMARNASSCPQIANASRGCTRYFYGNDSDKGLIARITSERRCPNRIARAA
jgi:hypothetical protein